MPGRYRSGRREVDGPPQRIPLQLGESRLESDGLFRSRASSQESAAGRDQSFGDGPDLLDGFPLAEDDFRMPLPQAAMMIELGERKLLRRKVPQPVECCGGIQAPSGHIAQQPLELVASHAT